MECIMQNIFDLQSLSFPSSPEYKNIRQNAENGEPLDQRLLGMMYWRGEGVSYNPEQAILWLERAAENEDNIAQFFLGSFYRYGSNFCVEEDCYIIKQDYSKALYWFEKSATQDNPDAQLSMAILYMQGQGVTKDFAIGHYWLQLAANNGNEIAKSTLDGAL